MKYDGGYLHKHVRWVKLDKRNWLKSRYSHRITSRDLAESRKLQDYFINNFESYASSWWGDAAPTIFVEHDGFNCRHFYLNEEDLVKLIIGYV